MSVIDFVKMKARNIILQTVYLLLFVLVFLGEAVGLTLETLSLRFVDDALHATVLTVALGIVHISFEDLKIIIFNSNSGSYRFCELN